MREVIVTEEFINEIMDSPDGYTEDDSTNNFKELTSSYENITFLHNENNIE